MHDGRHDSLTRYTLFEIQRANSLLVRSDDPINQPSIQVRPDLNNPPLAVNLRPATAPRIGLIVRVAALGHALIRKLNSTPIVAVAAANDVDDALPHGRRRVHDGRQPRPRLAAELGARAVRPAQRRLRLHGPFWRKGLRQRGLRGPFGFSAARGRRSRERPEMQKVCGLVRLMRWIRTNVWIDVLEEAVWIAAA